MLSTTESRSAKFVTSLPRTPLPRLLRIFIRCSVTLCVEVSETASSVVLWIVPPVHASAVVAHAPPVPVTFRPPVVPVVYSLMPVVEPLDEIESKLRLPDVIPAVSTLSAVPVPVVIELPVPPTVTVPLVALNPVPLVVSMSRPPFVNETRCPPAGLPFAAPTKALQAPVLSTFDAPEKLVEPALLPLTTMPPPASAESAMLPENVTPPPSRPVTSTDWPDPSLIAPS